MAWKHLVIVIFFVGCAETNSSNGVVVGQNVDLGNKMINDIQQIGSIIELSHIELDSFSNLNCAINSIGSNSQRVPGPTDYYLLATMKVHSLDTQSLEKISVIENPLDSSSTYYAGWLPGNVKEALFHKEGFRPIGTYSAKMFYKSPYLSGFFILLDDSTIYLRMETY